MEKNNLWNIGDIAICIDAHFSTVMPSYSPIRKFGEYTVKNISKCPICGIVLLDIGISTSEKYHYCTSCYQSVDIKDNIWLFRATRFIKKQDNELSEFSIEEILSPVNVLAVS